MQQVEINIPSDHKFERIARDSAAIIARYLGLPDERLADLQLAVSEAVTNAIEHGNRCRADLPVGVRFLLRSERLYVCIVDHGGCMPEVVSVEAPLLEEKLQQETPRGLGMFLIQQLSDGMTMRSRNGRTEFTMWFNLEAPLTRGAGSEER